MGVHAAQSKCYSIKPNQHTSTHNVNVYSQKYATFRWNKVAIMHCLPQNHATRGKKEEEEDVLNSGEAKFYRFMWICRWVLHSFSHQILVFFSIFILNSRTRALLWMSEQRLFVEFQIIRTKKELCDIEFNINYNT